MKFKHKIITDKGNKTNEDSYCADEVTFGVFDGAGSFTKYEDKGQTAGFIASSTVSRYYSDRFKTLYDQTLEANNALHDLMVRKDIDVSKGANRWSTTVSVIRILKDKLEWVNIGDSSIIVINSQKKWKLINPYHNHDIQILKYVQSIANRGIEDLIGYQPFIQKSVELQNDRNKTYGVLDGSEDAIKFIDHGFEPLDDIKNILLVTDGAYIPQESPEKENFQLLVDIYLKSGAEGIKDYVRNLQESDPLCQKFPRFKQFDDLTILEIAISK